MQATTRVLVIDDDPNFVATVQDLLMDERYLVDGVTSVGAALDRLWQDWEQQPDAILLAQHLSAVEGQPFAELYHVLPVPHAPVLLVSGEATAREASPLAEEAPAAVAASNLEKPVTREALLACLERATGATEQESALTMLARSA